MCPQNASQIKLSISKINKGLEIYGTFDIIVDPILSNETFFFDYEDKENSLDETYKTVMADNFTMPTLIIKSIDMRGIVVIEFSDKFIIPEDYEGLTVNSLEILIQPIDG